MMEIIFSKFGILALAAKSSMINLTGTFNLPSGELSASVHSTWSAWVWKMFGIGNDHASGDVSEVRDNIAAGLSRTGRADHHIVVVEPGLVCRWKR